MRNLILMLSTLVFSVLFLFYRPQGEIGFPFSDTVITIQTWLYFLFEHLILVILAIVIFDLSEKYKLAAFTFIVIQLIDTVDYCLTYGEPWFNSVVTWNTLKIGLFMTAIVYEYGRRSN